MAFVLQTLDRAFLLLCCVTLMVRLKFSTTLNSLAQRSAMRPFVGPNCSPSGTGRSAAGSAGFLGKQSGRLAAAAELCRLCRMVHSMRCNPLGDQQHACHFRPNGADLLWWVDWFALDCVAVAKGWAQPWPGLALHCATCSRRIVGVFGF